MSSAKDNPQAGKGQALPKKEHDLFKSVVKHYETKQYKKGIKAADNILKKFPNHGETLCMKGLTLQCMGKKDEAIVLVKQGLMQDMR
jgi:peptide alpha-N-acetyltransferase